MVGLEPWVRASQYMLILKEKVWLRQIALLGMPWLIRIHDVLVDLYAKCDEACEARIIFGSLNIGYVLWNVWNKPRWIYGCTMSQMYAKIMSKT